MRRTTLFVLVLLVWVLLVWPIRPPERWALSAQDVLAGIAATLIVVLVMGSKPTGKTGRRGLPVRCFWLVVYLFVIAYYVVKANLDVVYRVLHPDMPIRPGIVKVKTDLKTASAVTVLANSITLTPGTLTVNVTEDGYLYVHWIYVVSDDPEEAAGHITRKFEWFIKRIFE